MSGPFYSAGAALVKAAHSIKLAVGLFAILATGIVFDPAETAERTEQQQTRACLALVGFAEARSDGDVAMATVMRVAMNRANDPARRWPRTVCAVVTQPAQFLGVEQLHPQMAELRAWRRALELADATIAGTAPVPTACMRATNFHRSPMVAGLAPVCSVGVHTFFTEGTWHRSTTAMKESILPAIRMRGATIENMFSRDAVSFEGFNNSLGEYIRGCDRANAGDAVYTLAGYFVPAEPVVIPFAAGQEVKTRGGHCARIIATNLNSGDRWKMYAVVSANGRESVESYSASGSYLGDDACENEFDLIANVKPASGVTFVRA